MAGQKIFYNRNINLITIKNMKIFKNRLNYILVLLAGGFILRFYIMNLLGEANNLIIRIFAIVAILGLGAFFILRGTAKIIEETTSVLTERTKLAGGLLQSFGTAFPDMVLGIMAAIVSVSLRKTNYTLAINYAIIAAATTFGSNVYNIGHAAWCIFRQNLANAKGVSILMFPKFKFGGTVKPIKDHVRKPSIVEFDTAINISTALTVLTAIVALSMVIFGQVKIRPSGIESDLYQLIRPVGVLIFILGVYILYYFRKTKRAKSPVEEIEEEEEYFKTKNNSVIWGYLIISGIAILLAAESMVRAIEALCEITALPYVIAGVLAGIIGCLGEMIVVHNFSVHPNGRIGDAVVGVAMDNIVTIIGASIVAIMGGIFLGGNSLILIFVIILTLNTVLIWQISQLKNYFLKE
jgi:hypothetical protein